ncbi:molybdate ABC transporter substrate-binding protein [Bradyrhizobium sp. JYMT SZCCT0428]|uniref:molybdate ABC transporter substrate-binding protein n=1 Tax=Bradyrhizobium sp. JYMT SZCCT0428 TaxID=2807673 RepID=UPI001BAD8778|nr:molybdate ABC transporter substrate-binding protein [Bradyrhizobium sp. JYMT SZCCT0428]MBR1155142.1 molybdate ABC transporter substrate-binding protein [Bradyrhizobium sp. JYMT SZCCT0428]
MRIRLFASLAVLALMSAPAIAEDQVLLHAAGSLRGALSDVAASFEAATGTRVKSKFGASGLLKDEIAGGAKAEVFASANMEHPRALALAKRSGPAVLFARNKLCALVRPGLAIEPATLLDRMLDAGIKLGTSTPRADPSGDYAWEVFRKADKIKPGAYALLDKKALQLTGGPTSPPAPPDRSIYGNLLAQGAADIFLTYCTGALAAQKENPAQQIVGLPDTLAVGADYGLTVINDASAPAYKFALFILSTEGQQLLAKHGFAAPGAAP